MIEKTKVLKDMLREKDGLRAKLDALSGFYAGETCFAIATGPSVKTYVPDLSTMLSDQLVFAVKDIFRHVSGISDWLIWNFFRTGLPKLKEVKHTVLVQRPINQTSNPLSDIVIPREDLKDELFDRVGLPVEWRQWGLSSILEETVMPLAVICGVRRLITIGYDLSTDGGDHFWTADGKRTLSSIEVERLPVLIERVPCLYQWLKSKNVEWLRVESPCRSPLSEIVPSIKLSDAIVKG